MRYEYPPILTGTQAQQIRALRDYLVRLIKELNKTEEERKDD